jgi:hypothetical protein
MFAKQELTRLAERKRELIAQNDQWRLAVGLECEHLRPTVEHLEKGIEFARTALATLSLVVTLVQGFATVKEANTTSSPWWVRTLRLWRAAQRAAELLHMFLNATQRGRHIQQI